MHYRSVASYLGEPETMRRRELVWGIVREPAAPFYSHQRLITDLAVLLQLHTRATDAGSVCVSPIDVVLDVKKKLIVQPDIIFIAKDRLEIIRHQVWGAPDLAVEILSPGSVRYDSQQKLRWYDRYGAREYWLVDQRVSHIVVYELGGGRPRKSVFRVPDTLESAVLPGLRLKIHDLFDLQPPARVRRVRFRPTSRR